MKLKTHNPSRTPSLRSPFDTLSCEVCPNNRSINGGENIAHLLELLVCHSRRLCGCTIIAAFCATNILPAAEFQNLGFDEGNAIGVGTGQMGSVRQLLPGWSVSSKGLELDVVQYNNLALGESGIIAVYDQGGLRFLPVPYEGNFGVAAYGTLHNEVPLILSQTATVPLNASYLRFDYAIAPWTVRLNGVVLDKVSEFPNRIDFFTRTTAFYDIASFAGKEATLEFEAPRSPIGQFVSGTTFLDSLAFTNVPEAGTLALLGAGGALLWSLSKRRKESGAVE